MSLVPLILVFLKTIVLKISNQLSNNISEYNLSTTLHQKTPNCMICSRHSTKLHQIT
nr:MAG TPA: hypothetical protein [Caudoviricetes sp.]